MPLYFAFGSNLNPRQMKVRCPGAVRIGPLVLPKGRLVFRGVADVVSDPHSTIAGGVWRITDNHVRELDRFEGVDNGRYRKKYIKLSIKGGRSESCLYYQMVDKKGIMPPTEKYFETILAGYKWFGLDDHKLSAALSEAWADKDITPVLAERHVNRGRPKLKRVA